MIAPTDQVVKSIQHALQSNQSILSANLITETIFDDDPMVQEETGERSRKVTVDFALAEYNVLVVPAVSGVEWMVSPCHVIQ